MIAGGHPATTICGGNPFCRSAVAAEVGSVEEARSIVARLASEGVDFIKVVSDNTQVPVQLPDDVMAAIIAQAHRKGLEVVGHVAEPVHMRSAATAALDGFVHPFHPVRSSMTPDATRQLANLLVQHGASVTTTLSSLLLFSDATADAATRRGSPLNDRLIAFAGPLSAMAEEGVQLVVGTDWCACAPGANKPETEPGSVTVTEMELLVQVGLSPERVLAAATINAARALRMEHEIGTLAAGKFADLLVVNGNPLEDIRHLRDVRTVVSGGQIIRN